MLNIAIANDTVIAVEALRRTIAGKQGYHLLWVAQTGAEAVEQCAAQRPDIILMDMNMPDLDGVEATRQIMQQSPCAILIVTASVTVNTPKVFEAMGYGALDVVKTPPIGIGNGEAIQALLNKMATIAKLARPLPTPLPPLTPQPFLPMVRAITGLPPLVVIGASTGGPKALQQLLSQLPSSFEAAIVIIQHIAEPFASGLVNWLNQFSRLPVAIACNGDRPKAGQILVAGTNHHLILRPNHTLRYTRVPLTQPHRPSVDVFFESVAQHWPQPGTAILLTGMGRDGAMGMAQLRSLGWHTMAESVESCVVFGMPKAAIDLGAACQVLPIGQIAPHLIKIIDSLILHT